MTAVVPAQPEEDVWNRLYEDGLGRQEKQNRVRPIPEEYTFMPIIGDYAAEMYHDEDVHQRLYDERLQRDENMKFRLREENERLNFLPNGAGEYNEECWTRLYSDGMQKLKKDMELSARSGSEFTYRPSITQYFAEDAGPDGQIFDRLYKDAEQKKEDDALRQKEADEIFRKVHSFRPSISSEVEGRGEGVYQELYQDARGRQQRNLEKEQEQERLQKAQLFKPAIHDIGVAAKYMEPPTPKPLPMPTPEDADLFVPRTNSTKGVAPKYLEPKRRFEPLEPAPVAEGERAPWISPLEATLMAQRQEQCARRSRSATALFRGLDNLGAYDADGPGTPRRTYSRGDKTPTRIDPSHFRRSQSTDAVARYPSPARGPQTTGSRTTQTPPTRSGGRSPASPARRTYRREGGVAGRAQSAGATPRTPTATDSGTLRVIRADDRKVEVPEADRGRKSRSTVRNADRVGFGSRFKCSLAKGGAASAGLQAQPAAFRTDGLSRIGGSRELATVTHQHPPIGMANVVGYVSARRIQADAGQHRTPIIESEEYTVVHSSALNTPSRSSSLGRSVSRESRVVDLTKM